MFLFLSVDSRISLRSLSCLMIDMFSLPQSGLTGRRIDGLMGSFAALQAK